MTKPGPIRFGVFEADLAARTLRKSGARVRLQEKPFRVLAMLLARPGEVVTRDELKQELWPNEEYGEFDLSLNTAVKKVRKALGDSGSHPRWIETLPKVGYRFLAPTDAPDPTPRRPAFPWVKAGLGGAVASVIALGAAAWFGEPPDPPAPALRERPLTSVPGVESNPNFSPDGTRVAYDWRSALADESSNIHVSLTEPGAGEPLRVTAGHRDSQPAWSPDGAKIVFARHVGERLQPPLLATFQLMLASPVESSPVQVLGEYRSRAGSVHPAWSPDGKYIGFSCHIDAPESLKQICIYSLASGEVSPLTSPTGNVGDEQVAFSPNGRAVAYQGSGQLYVLDVTDDMRPKGARRALADRFAYPQVAGWSGDGALVYFYGGLPTGEQGLWAVERENGSEPRLVHPRRGRLRYPDLLWTPDGGMQVVGRDDVFASQIMRLDLTADRVEAPIPLTHTAGAANFNPRFSPDGSRVAFMSDRTGVGAVWLCNSDGSNPELLHELPPFAGFSEPSWSPDGSQIALDAVFLTQRRDVYVIDVAAKRASKNLTDGGGRWPSFSNAHNRLYFTPGQGAGIWTLDLSTGQTRSFLQGYGTDATIESPDARTLYFEHRDDIMAVPLGEDGEVKGEALTVATDAIAFAVAQRGVYFVTRSGQINSRTPAGIVESVFDLGSAPARSARSGIAVSPDERWLLYTDESPSESNLMLLESIE